MDDHAAASQLLGRLLEKLQQEVRLVHSGEAALEELSDHRAHPLVHDELGQDQQRHRN